MATAVGRRSAFDSFERKTKPRRLGFPRGANWVCGTCRRDAVLSETYRLWILGFHGRNHDRHRLQMDLP